MAKIGRLVSVSDFQCSDCLYEVHTEFEDPEESQKSDGVKTVQTLEHLYTSTSVGQSRTRFLMHSCRTSHTLMKA